MKRSKMIELIIDDLKDIILVYNISGNIDLNVQAQLILQTIEKAGMLPPDYTNTIFGWNEGWIDYPQWEPENE